VSAGAPTRLEGVRLERRARLRLLRLILPNVLTLGRLVSVPLIVYLMLIDEMWIAFWLFVASGVTDALDGLLARVLDARTLVGSYLDPIADKALLVSVYVMLGHAQYLPVWLVILVVSRDLLIIGGAILQQMLDQPAAPSPLMISKVNTATQIALAAFMLAALAYDLETQGLLPGLVGLTAVTTVMSGAAYLARFTRSLMPEELKR
jgi:cardiolipin synthase